MKWIAVMMGDCVTDVVSALQFGLFVRMSGNGNIIYHVKIQCEGPLYQSQISGEESVEHKCLRATYILNLESVDLSLILFE